MSDSYRVEGLSPETFVACCAYARETMRRWKLEPDWLDSDQPVDDPSLAFAARLRRRRQLGSLRVLWDEIRGRHDVEHTGSALSELASACLSEALNEAERRVAEASGTLPDSDEHPARLAILALGKLGGNELNFNSDLDLVFAHRAEGTSDGRRALPAREYLGRVARELSRLMEEITADGRAWVIDTRLRPYGQSGALVWSLDAMEQYFLNEGRTWERYAWLKARPVAGDLSLGIELLKRLQPFVFRRYLDYGLFDSLRELHAEIDRKGRREDLADDIKRGAGGIRELEFLVQSVQLLRGGTARELRCSGFLPALRAARGLQLIDPHEADSIESAYRFLRVLENRLQAVTGRQTHRLPDSDEQRNQLARMMGTADWPSLARRIDEVRESARELFHARFDSRPASGDPATTPWPPASDLVESLASLGFADPERAAEAIRRLDKRLSQRPLSAEARRRLDRLMPTLFENVAREAPPDTGFADILALLETIARRSAYLALLHERPQTLSRMVRIFRRSERLAEWITASPQLLDDLLDPINGFRLPGPPTVQPDDVEGGLNALARYRQAGFVRTALGQLDGSLDRADARAQLTTLAEQVLGAGVSLTRAGDQPEPAVIGYGNLGASELHYTSDLDLVFLHEQGDPPLRSIQRLINALQLPLPGGKLYAVDTRLRPNGNAGLLVSTIESFIDYQRRHAWTWEHQALIRARMISGPETVKHRFEDIRAEVLARRREPAECRQALFDMRQRQLGQRREGPEKRLLGDIQFIAELGILLGAHAAPDLVAQRATISQLGSLGRTGWLNPDEAAELIEIHAEVAALRDRRFLDRECSETIPPDFPEAVGRTWRRVFGNQRND